MEIVKLVLKFFNSSFFIAIVTIITGAMVILVYLDQKQQEKKNATVIILMEIRNAESAIDNIKRSKDLRTVSILPNNSWTRFNHLFVKDLDRDELDAIDSFYRLCSLAEIELRRINSFLPLAMEEKAKAIYNKLLELSQKYSNNTPEDNLKSDSDYSKEKRHLLDTYYKDEEFFIAYQPSRNLINDISNIKFIMNSPIGQKLKSIAEIK